MRKANLQLFSLGNVNAGRFQLCDSIKEQSREGENHGFTEACLDIRPFSIPECLTGIVNQLPLECIDSVIAHVASAQREHRQTIANSPDPRVPNSPDHHPAAGILITPL